MMGKSKIILPAGLTHWQCILLIYRRYLVWVLAANWLSCMRS